MALLAVLVVLLGLTGGGIGWWAYTQTAAYRVRCVLELLGPNVPGTPAHWLVDVEREEITPSGRKTGQNLHEVHNRAERFGPEEQRLVCQATTASDPDKRFAAVVALMMTRYYDPACYDASVAAARRALRDPRTDVRRGAAFALGYLRPRMPEVILDLVAALEDPDRPVRLHIVAALGAIGAAAAPSVPALIRIIRQENDLRMRLAAMDALGRIGPEAANAVPAVLTILRGGTAPERRAAMFAAGKIGPAARPAVPCLVGALESEDRDTRGMAAMALGDMGRAGAGGVPALGKMLRLDDRELRRCAARALAGIGAEAGRAVPDLLSALKGNDPEVRSWALVALGKVGPAAKTAVPALIQLLDEPQKETRAEASEALGCIGPGADDAVPALIRVIEADSGRTRIKAIEALGKIRPEHPEAVPVLAKCLDDPDPLVLAAAARALRAAGATDEFQDAVRALGDALPQWQSDSGNRGAAMAVELGRLGREAHPAIPALAEAAEKGPPWMRYAAAAAVFEITGERPPGRQLAASGWDLPPRGGRFDSSGVRIAVEPGGGLSLGWMASAALAAVTVLASAGAVFCIWRIRTRTRNSAHIEGGRSA